MLLQRQYNQQLVIHQDFNRLKIWEKALGLIEFIGYVPAICAADTALKAANVDLIGIEKVTGGIVTVKIRGDVDAVQAAIGAAENYASRIGSLRSVHVIPRLDDEVENLLMNSINTEEESLGIT